MSDKLIVYIVVAVVVAHFIFAAVYLIYKVYSAPKNNDHPLNEEKDKHL